ncbi:putative prefoldin subunit 5 [Porphyridium purpureum]|uniref:Putative prefoldin subunit 5 n=1 Tax=Porphyridium purpureum TaxID=35688 RepID=A0A5J4ZAI1_PORPP|nr:putative prefoldin subunit 5 [Porphyridium purpureum]|eukprot:POR1829..scf295_1
MAVQGGSVHLGSLSIEQLQQLRKAGQDEIEDLSQSLAQLQNAVYRLNNSKHAAGEYATLQAGNEILVPMTPSVYVPGSVIAQQNLLVDLGTGYYAEMTVQEAEAYFARRVKTVKEQIEKATQMLSQKRQQIEAITIVLQRKTMLAAGAAPAAAGSS